MSLLVFLSVFSLLGYANGLALFCRVKNQYSYLTAVSTISLLTILLALLGCLQIGAVILLAIGLLSFVFSVACLLSVKVDQADKKQLIQNNLLFLGFSVFVAFYAWHLSLHEVDDYSYWAAISKYIFSHHALPNMQANIAHEHLAYTPGLALWHYFINLPLKHISAWGMYFAQDLIIVSSMLVFADKELKLKSILACCLLFIAILTFAYGNFFGRLMCESELGAIMIALFWLIMKEDTANCITCLIVLVSVLELFLIKQVGFYCGLVVLALYVAANFNKNNRFYLLLQAIFIFAGMLALKFIWVWHYRHIGFQPFDHGINLHRILASLNPFNAKYHAAQIKFLEAALFFKADMVIRLPYVAYYLAMFAAYFLWRSRIALRAKRMLLFFIPFYLFYLIMIYWLGALVFAVSSHVGFDIFAFNRYSNILLGPFVGLLIYSLLNIETVHFLWRYFIYTLAVLCIVIGRIRLAHSTEFFAQRDLALTIKSVLKLNSRSQICMAGFPIGRGDVWTPVQYYLQQHKLIKSTNLKMLRQCDYFARYNNKQKSQPIAGFKLIFTKPFESGYAHFYQKKS